MTISDKNEDLLKSILESFDRIRHVDSADLPNIDLYMDQVTTFMDSRMKATTRHPETDKILTKTMINNYAKNDLLPPPVKKKYSKEHMLVLIFIYYFKNVMSINDIQEILGPLTERYFHTDDDRSLKDIYDEVFSLRDQEVELLKSNVEQSFGFSRELFGDAEGQEKDFLQHFAFITMLCVDVYAKKLLIEKLVDQIREEKMPADSSEEATRGKHKKD
ncbi:MAG: DUF1836 domain-containing protein [Lachnospiraceae bacterium]|nr:DUF1836 domain-containing protein [Lachnospiraceae bacterium]